MRGGGGAEYEDDKRKGKRIQYLEFELGSSLLQQD